MASRKQPQSISSLQPWREHGLSRSGWYYLKKREADGGKTMRASLAARRARLRSEQRNGGKKRPP